MSACEQFTQPGQVAPDRPAPDACMQCGQPEATHALQAVLDALDIPAPATVGDEVVHDRILHERVLHAVIFLRGVLDDRREGRFERALGYFREKLAEHPATGYRTWDQAVAETRARREAQR